MPASRHETVPRYFLYGEAPRDVAADFLHLEELDERSRPSGWNIRAHAHDSLAHIFVLSSGGGHARADGLALSFDAPAMLLIPPRCVHAFTWQTETRGWVLTISESYLARLVGAAREFAGLFAQPRCLVIPDGVAGLLPIEQVLLRVNRELTWTASAHVLALEASVTTLLIDACRLCVPDTAPRAARPRRLAERFIATIEAEFRTAKPLSCYAKALGTPPASLRAAVRAATGQTPAAYLKERRILEAKRLLLYSNVSIAEAAFATGFEDPAYFSRVFQRTTGTSPRGFRLRHADR